MVNLDEAYTKAELKRYIKIVEIQKDILKRQRRCERIYTLYTNLLEQWIIQHHQNAVQQNKQREKAELESKNSEIDEIFNSILTSANEYTKTKPVFEKYQYITEVGTVIEKDKIISDIANFPAPLIKYESAKITKDRDKVIPSNRDQTNGLIAGGLYQCFEIDFDILVEYIRDYIQDLNVLQAELANESKITEGYKFLLFSERNKIEKIEKQLLKTYSEEIKILNILKDINEVNNENYRKNVEQILGKVYSYDVGELNLEDALSMADVLWTKESIHIEEIHKSNLFLDLKLATNDIVDEIQDKIDVVKYLTVMNHLKEGEELLIELPETFESNVCLEDDNLNFITIKGTSNPNVISVLESCDESKNNAKMKQKQLEELQNELNEIEMKMINYINEEKKRNENCIIGFIESNSELVQKYKENVDSIDKLDSSADNSNTMREISDKEKSSSDVSFSKQDDIKMTRHLSLERSHKQYKMIDHDSTLNRKVKIVRQLSEDSINNQITATQLLNANAIGQNRKFQNMKTIYKGIFFNPDKPNSISDEFIDPSVESDTFSLTPKGAFIPRNQRPLRKFKEKAMHGDLLTEKHSIQIDAELKGFVNVQNIIVDGEVLRIADLSHKMHPVRNQPRKLSFNRKRTAKVN